MLWEELLEASRTQQRLKPVELEVTELVRGPNTPLPYALIDGKVVQEPKLLAQRQTAAEAFRSTLDVVIDADLLVHLVDASSPDPEGDIEAVRQVLRETWRRGGFDDEELLIGTIAAMKFTRFGDLAGMEDDESEELY